MARPSLHPSNAHCVCDRFNHISIAFQTPLLIELIIGFVLFFSALSRSVGGLFMFFYFDSIFFSFVSCCIIFFACILFVSKNNSTHSKVREYRVTDGLTRMCRDAG